MATTTLALTNTVATAANHHHKNKTHHIHSLGAMPSAAFFGLGWLPIAILVFLFKYLRTFAGILTWNLYKPIKIQAKPTFTTSDVTVIVPTTFKTPDELVKCLNGITRCLPAAIFVVTADPKVQAIKDLVDANSLKNITVLGVDKFNKRVQMVRALKQVETQITVFADDDVIWPNDKYLDYLLACFEKKKIGACGSRQRTQIRSGNMWNILGVSYLERRNWNNLSIAIDGSISTLSGRTSAYRTHILKNEDFFHAFLNQTWQGLPLNSDDDKSLTRWVYSHGHHITLQFDPNAILETTLEESELYLDQCGRWARARFRGNFTVMSNEKYWCSLQYWWGFYSIYLSQFLLSSLVYDALLFFLFHCAFDDPTARTWAFSSLAIWTIFTKNIKMIPHFCRRPQDLKFIPVLMAFSYYHGYLNTKALLSLNNVAWSGKNLKSLESTPATNTITTDKTPLLQAQTTVADETPDVTYVIPSQHLTPELTADNDTQSGQIVGSPRLLLPEYFTMPEDK